MTGARGDAAARPQQKLKGALILSAAVLVTGLQDAFIKDLSAAYPVWEMQIFRGGSALLLIFGWIVMGGGLRQLIGTRPSGFCWHALRSCRWRASASMSPSPACSSRTRSRSISPCR